MIWPEGSMYLAHFEKTKKKKIKFKSLDRKIIIFCSFSPKTALFWLLLLVFGYWLIFTVSSFSQKCAEYIDPSYHLSFLINFFVARICFTCISGWPIFISASSRLNIRDREFYFTVRPEFCWFVTPLCIL